MSEFRRSLQSIFSSIISCRTAHSRQRLMYEVSFLVHTERHAALNFIAAHTSLHGVCVLLVRQDFLGSICYIVFSELSPRGGA